MERPTVAPVHPSRRPAPWPVEFYRSAVGKKWVMALTGIGLMGYVFFHMLGNLKLYLGAEDTNHYGEWLRQLLVPFFPRTVTLWLLRIGLAGAFVFHIHSAASLTLTNRRARSQGKYVAKRDWQAATAASRSMRLTGVVILLFVVFHLADLTWGWINPDFERGDVFRNLVASFERPPIAAIYIVANIALGIHLFHGAWSMFQSLGLNNPKWNSWRKGFAAGFAGIVMIGNLSFPIAVLTGVIDADDNPDCRVDGDRIETCELYEEAGGEGATP
ncbi:MAG TPA: succinate dehydrogenase cytochrome b subunit [Acidimicrobiales bacterium]|nr:succinate dehydrogenase cytochrome b subunit [Acidimicrobiales bacterium]